MSMKTARSRVDKPPPEPSRFPVYRDQFGRWTFSEILYTEPVGWVVVPAQSDARLWVGNGPHDQVLLWVKVTLRTDPNPYPVFVSADLARSACLAGQWGFRWEGEGGDL